MPGVADPLRLAELLSARMSHDLSGTIGVLAATLELVTEEAQSISEPLGFAAKTADELVTHIRLLRAAWGATGDPLDLPALRMLASGLPGASRLRVDLTALPDGTVFPPPMARALLNLLLLARESLPAGGEIVLAGRADDIVISIAGPRAAWPSGLARCLANDSDAWAAVRDPRTLQMPLTVLLCRSLGLRLAVLAPAGADGFVLSLRLSKS